MNIRFSENMGSHVHAKSLYENKTDVYGVICLGMIGYFQDYKYSQEYPIHILSWFYGHRGDFITLVNKFGKGKFTRRFTRKFKRKATVKAKKLTAPPKLEGIDFSDHLNYWKYGFSATMITDTAFYRNPNYHEKSDTIETLDLKRMSQVIDSVYKTLVHLK